MAVIKNTWVEKLKSKKERNETAPAYEREPQADTYAYKAQAPKKRFSVPSCSNFVRTLRGVRK